MVRIDRLAMQGFKSFANRTLIPFPSGFNVVCGPNGSGKCLDGDSLVLLANGSYQKIRDLVNKALKTQSVETDDGYVSYTGHERIVYFDTKTLKAETKEIGAFVKRRSPDKMMRLRTRSGREVITTKYHPLFVLKDGQIVPAKAEELKEGTKIAVPRKISIEPETKHFYELLDLIIPEDGLYVSCRDDLKKIIIEMKGNSTWKELAISLNVPYPILKSFNDGQAMEFSCLVRILRRANLSNQEIANLIPRIKSKTSARGCKVPWSNSAKFSRLLGYLLSEGRLSDSNQVWFTNGTPEMVNDYHRILREVFDIRVTVNEYKENCWDVIGYSSAACIILNKFGMPRRGGTTIDKTITNIFLEHSGSEELGEMLNGLYSGDGYVSKNTVEITTKSPQLGYSIESILTRLGIVYNSRWKVKVATNSGFSGLYKDVVISNVDNIRLFSNFVNFTHEQKNRKMHEILSKESNPNLDLIDVNELVRATSRELGVNVKKMKKPYPRLDSYCYNQCTPSVFGVKKLVEELFFPIASKNGMYSISLEKLKLLAYSDLYWDELLVVEEIEPREEWVYDLCVEEHHNFVANNIFVHNSNILDALTFVLGIRSGKAIRADNLSGLVFAGGKGRDSADHAAVSLYIDNTDGTIKGLPEEIRVTRKVNKNGVSVYKINDETVNRRRVVDVLASAGIYADGHNIIMQGDVTNLIEMDSEERREIIDRVSGIAEFDDKKDKAEKELEKVEEKLKEARIVLNEKKSILDKLEKERDLARGYKSLQDQLMAVRFSIISKRTGDANEELTKLDEQINFEEKTLSEAEDELSSLDKKLEEMEREMGSVTSRIIKGDDRKLIQELSDLRTEIDRRMTKLDYNKREMARLDDLVNALREISSGPAKTVVDMGKPGVHGTIGSLFTVDEKFRTAAEVAAGFRINDIIVDTDGIAQDCIEHLKRNNLGRATFLPLNKLTYHDKSRESRSMLDEAGVLGFVIDKLKFDARYQTAFNQVFGDTLLVDTLQNARKHIGRARMVTLDGELLTPAGAITGGSLRKKTSDGSAYAKMKVRLEDETVRLESELLDLEKRMKELKEKEHKSAFSVTDFEKNWDKKQKEVESIRRDRQALFEKKTVAQSKIGNYRIKVARLEADLSNLGSEREGVQEVKVLNMSIVELERMKKDLYAKLDKIGPVNFKALEDFDSMKMLYDDLSKKVQTIDEEKNAVLKIAEQIESQRRDAFMIAFDSVGKHFSDIYNDVTGGTAHLELEETGNIRSGLLIRARPEGKKELSLDAMSGGEKTMTALSFLFAVQMHKPAPFYVLDEIDAALDKKNTIKVADLIEKYSKRAQFIVITHNDMTIRRADNVYGVSMENGVSKIVSLELPSN